MGSDLDGTLMAHLALAREILLREAATLMPKGGADQRNDTLATIDYLIAGASPLKTGVPASAYDALCEVFTRLSHLDLASQIIEWIQSTHSLPEIPPDAIENAVAALRVFSQRLLLQPSMRGWIEAIRLQLPRMEAEAARNAELMIRHWTEKAGLSEDFVNESSRVNHASFRAWEQAKPASDFAGWLPHLRQVVDCVQRKAAILGEALQVSPYQALLEQFNPGLRNETVNVIFAELHAQLPELTRRTTAKQAGTQPIALPPVALERQRRIIRRITHAMGFDAKFSRLDESMHPFSTGEWDDVRVTTRYHEHNLLSGIMGVVHEMGHLFYSRNLPREWKYLPIGAAQSMWIHESQSLFWEKQVACSREFMEFLSGILRQELDGADPAWSAENLFALATRVKPGLIRIEADEVTYPAHIILRHGVEQALIAGTLAPDDLPKVWAEQMQALLGVDVPDHAHGCMQDVHWTDGSFGYFPAYSFGALAAAQFMETARSALPNLPGSIRRGEFAPLQDWLKHTIHHPASRHDGETLVRQVTGKNLSIAPWLAHIGRRYID